VSEPEHHNQDAVVAGAVASTHQQNQQISLDLDGSYDNMRPPVPSNAGHWRFDTSTGKESFQTDGGAEQGAEDGGAVEKHMGGQDPELAKAVAEKKGPVASTDQNGIDNINSIKEAMNYEGDWTTDKDTGQPVFVASVPQKPGAEKFYHEKWLSPESHGASAYEPDFLHDNSENFGPFIIDYTGHNIKLPDWNLLVSSSSHTKGKGNVGLGIDNFYYDASNSFIAGKHNIVRGEYDDVFGGQDNSAEGKDAIVTGGQRNIASGDGTSVLGGFRNEALGTHSVVEGGSKNLAKGTYAAISGGIDNIAAGDFSVIAGGKGNEAQTTLSVVGGGEGNKVSGEGAIVAGGLGGEGPPDVLSVFQGSGCCNEEMSGTKDEDYRGCQSTTRSGRTCQKWTSQSPHGHSRTPSNYPGKGLGDHNFCRNPDGEPSIWCYTTDSSSRWELCNPKPSCTTSTAYTVHEGEVPTGEVGSEGAPETE